MVNVSKFYFQKNLIAGYIFRNKVNEIAYHAKYGHLNEFFLDLWHRSGDSSS